MARTVLAMTAQYVLREDAAELDRSIERLTSEIEDLEKKIVAAREKRETFRFHLAELRIAADFLDNNGFRVERDPTGVVTVSIDATRSAKPTP
jgi:uncharacterized membrane protein YgaE (UPF0421/DUF939 family)